MSQKTAAEFNPYREMLNIPTQRQSLTHYRLLGVTAFEDDSEAIDEAARRRLERLESHRDGAYAEECRRLEREIEAAAACLKDPVSREAYEQEMLHAHVMQPTTREAYRGGDGPGERISETVSLDRVGDGVGVDASETREDLVAEGTDAGNEFPGHPDYEITREVARGRHSIVYQAYDRALRRYVAIKELDAAYCRDPRSTETFWEEARFLANFRHPHIVTVHTVSASRRWIIMELMADNLANRVADRPMPADLVRSVLRQALEGLAYLHGQGKLHGQIGLANLLIDEAGHVKLNASPGYTAAGEFPAPDESQRHVAPELLNPGLFGAVGTGIDLYCLGFAMLELLTGPKIDGLFKGVKSGGDDAALGWMRWHNSPSETLPPIKQLVPSIPDDLARVIDRLVQKPVDARYATAQQALEDLDGGPFVAVPSQGRTAAVSRGKPSAAAPASAGPAAVTLGTPPDLHRLGSNAPGAARREGASDSPLERIGDRRFWSGLLEKPAFVYSIVGVAVVIILMAMLAGNPRPEVPVEPGPDPSSTAEDSTPAPKEKEEESAAPAAEPKVGRLVFETVPSGVEVVIDGKYRKVTPAVFELPSGPYVAEVKRSEDYEGMKGSVSVGLEGAHVCWALSRSETSTSTGKGPVETPLEDKGVTVVEPGTNQIVDLGPAQPPRRCIARWTRFASALPKRVRKVLESTLLEWERVDTPSRASFERCCGCGLHGADFDDPKLDYMWALIYYGHGTFDENREKAKLRLDAAMDGVKEPFFAPWRLRIWMHLQEEKWERAVSLSLRLLDQLNTYPPEDAATVEANVYFVACTVGFIQGLVEREAIAFGQFKVWIHEDLRSIDPRFCGLYDDQRVQLARFVRELPADRVESLGRLRDSILIENCGLPMNVGGLQADFRRALSRSATPGRVTLSALDRR